ncbi:MAG: NADH:flavin oxidoreductase/NADH oxidase [Proteobacteria bacterium]|nr:NADH:flavin oxidoreductase/NADH oxidase [Pseudomonadota bacterium]MBI3495965.1 NADH:flavin oxidoreductase/NADH oxidase [Pseudomonadota bacterium]
MAHLFDPLSLRGRTAPNRIVVSPMCQYSAIDGSATDWHVMHLGQFATGGPGIVFTEATAVSPEGRITPACLGLYSEANERALVPALRFFRRHGAGLIGIQLAHAGRKASTAPPWQGGVSLAPPQGWQTVAPSAVPFKNEWPTPVALDATGMAKVKSDFVAATERSLRLGFDVIELHGAHGYLISEFLSPIANKRTDSYGGGLANRMRFPLEIFDSVRKVWPADRPLGMRLNGSDYVEDGWTIEDAVTFVGELKRRGCDFVDMSGGAQSPDQKVPLAPGYQVPFAERVRRETGIVAMAVGLITEPRQAEAIIASGQADFVALARAMLRNPHWAWEAAAELGAEAYHPPQYLRANPAVPRDTRVPERKVG